ncbi:TIGR02147 family protein [Fibrobacter sp. UWCM]|uniref:TIGR02147 family protein n=1 Tax=Fibrobacter sp. UWCM TaxID=1896208 RepID=UPI00091D0448|nr:TIGR02147 family protein [Fibrobacter sp. UWCM]SHH17412.1 TIGR02147 family protein [Fibrobacter sp. UWCM]
MRPITEYQDYREYMRDFYAERKRSSYFTWRKFASLAGFASPAYLKLVSDGKTSLSKPGIAKAARAMGLEGFDYTYFTLLVKFGNAKSDSEKESALRELEREAQMNKIRIVDADAFRYYENPAYPIIHELAPLMPNASFGEIASKVKHEITAAQVRDILQFLVKADLLKKNDDGTYEQTQKAVKGSKETIPLVIRTMNRKMSELAVQSITKDSVEERNFSGITMGINKSVYDRITKEIDIFRKKIIDIANECRDIDQVYQMNLQVFPLTDKATTSDKRRRK